jgi:hypothetical protein
MPRFSRIVFCERFLVDATTNNVSIINLLDEIHLRPIDEAELPNQPKGKIPAIPHPCVAAAFWDRDHREQPETVLHDVRVRLLSPRGRTLMEAAGELDLRTYPRARVVVQAPVLPIDGEGVYVWRAAIRTARGQWKNCGSYEFAVSFLRTPEDLARVNERARAAVSQYRGATPKRRAGEDQPTRKRRAH